MGPMDAGEFQGLLGGVFGAGGAIGCQKDVLEHGDTSFDKDC
jgi:hypothetical protein